MLILLSVVCFKGKMRNTFDVYIYKPTPPNVKRESIQTKVNSVMYYRGCKIITTGCMNNHRIFSPTTDFYQNCRQTPNVLLKYHDNLEMETDFYNNKFIGY